MNYTEFRLKFRHFVRRYQKIILIGLMIWAVVFLLNLLIKHRTVEPEAERSFEAHTSVMDSTKSTPKVMQKSIEDIVEEYIKYCNEGNYQKAFNMLSEDCREYGFDNNVSKFMNHVLVKMPTPKKYALQDYSNINYNGGKIYIYEIKYLDDYLATGLTNSTYTYTSEKISFFEDEDGNIQMNVGNFIYYSDVKCISENDYLKLDVVNKTVNYSIETYKVKLTNRSNYTIVIADGQEEDEVALKLSNEVRKLSDINDIILKPGEEKELEWIFPKFIDDQDPSQAVILSSVRVMEKYSGTEDVPEEVRKSEIDNAIAKFSMEAVIVEK